MFPTYTFPQFQTFLQEKKEVVKEQLSRLQGHQISRESGYLSKVIQRIVESILRKIVQLSYLLRYTLHDVRFRAKKGEVLTIIQQNQTSLEFRDVIENFLNFDVVPKVPFEKGPLTVNQKTKLEQLLLKEDLSAQDKEALASLQKMSLPKRATRHDFNLKEWQALDLVNFTLIQDYLINLNQLFQTDYLELFKNNIQVQFDVDYQEALIAETLAKSLAYLMGMEGKEIQLPVLENNSSRLVSYTIDKIHLGDSLPCYILKSQDLQAKPWIVIRGTEVILGEEKGQELRQGAFESILADTIDRSGLSTDIVTKSSLKSDLESNVKNLETEISKFIHAKQKINLTGHSLGGYLVNDIAIRFAPHIHTAYGFSAPSVGQELGNSYKQKIASGVLQAHQIVNFDVEGDPIASAGHGEGLVGLRIAVQPILHFNRKESPIHCHLQHNLKGHFKLQQVDIEKESKKLSRRVATATRAIVGKIVLIWVQTFYQEQLPDWWKNRYHYRQQYEQQMACQNPIKII